MKRIFAVASAAMVIATSASAMPLYLEIEEDPIFTINEAVYETPVDFHKIDMNMPEMLQLECIEIPEQAEYAFGVVEMDSLDDELPDSVLMLQNNLADYARSYLGTPYVWGSKGPRTFDCSGFMTWVFKKHGLDIGHGSRYQATKGQKISLDEARVGDLMFFTLPREVGSGRVGHVGMVIDVDPATGNLKFIHASSKGGVKISDFPDKGAYNRRFLQIRRVIDDDNINKVLASK